IRVPACGQTVCDDPTVVRSYAASPQQRQHKKIKYRVVNVCEDDGTNPSVGDEQIHAQDVALNAAFRPYNISWELEVVRLPNTALRRKTIMFGCSSNKIGNKQCDIECRHPITGNDG
uniref:Uncharacterized protein n=1 Tax=Plectus sambesii TaxID=2011161 RepID=A0A914VTH3_9BILA